VRAFAEGARGARLGLPTIERFFNWIIDTYGRTLTVVLRHPTITLLVLAATIALNGYLFVKVPKGFFPQQDNGRMQGTILGDQDTSFQAMEGILLQMVKIVQADPAIDTMSASTGGGGGGGGGTINQGRVNIQLKPLNVRKVSVYEVIDRLRPQLARVRGATLILQAAQDVRVGGRQSAALYQFTMRGDNLQDLTTFGRPDAGGAAESPDHHRRQQRSAEQRLQSVVTTIAIRRRASAFRRS